MIIRKLINDFINRITRRPQSVMLQFGSRRSYLLKENGEIVTVDSCVCAVLQGNKEIYSIANRGFCSDLSKVIWPIKEEVVVDSNGVKALVEGVISQNNRGKKLNIYTTTMSPLTTNTEMKMLSDYIKYINKVHSLYITSKPIAIAVGIGVDINRKEPIHIVEMHCECRGHYSCKGSFQYGIEVSTIAEGKLTSSEWINARENNVVEYVLSMVKTHHPFLCIVGDCDDIYQYCRRFNETDSCYAVVPDNPDCIALLGLKKMSSEDKYAQYFINRI